jgi:hypothetical protein
MEDCTAMGCKEMERIETLVEDAKTQVYSMRDKFKDIIGSRIYGQGQNQSGCDLAQPTEVAPSNKIDRIMLDLHKIINTLKAFKKEELKSLEDELRKL